MARNRSERFARESSPMDTIANLLVIVLVAVVGFLAWPYLSAQFQARIGLNPPSTQSPTTRAYPTADTTALDLLRQQAEQTAAAAAAELQALNNAIPTEDTSKPPLAPTDQAARQLQQGGVATTVPATSFSPSDLGNRPVPTPTTMLSQEQYDASQASEEQQFLDNAAQGLTEAQKLVKIHEAEQQAKGQP